LIQKRTSLPSRTAIACDSTSWKFRSENCFSSSEG